MALDVFISGILAVLTMAMAYLGIHVTLHPPNEAPRAQFWYKAGFCFCALCTVSLVIWQGVRSARVQQSASQQISALQHDVEGAKTEAQNARQEVQNESTRRQQAERDLAIIVQNAGRSTREGVVSDIRQSPIKVQVNGIQAEVAPLQVEDIKLISSIERSNHPDSPYAAKWILTSTTPTSLLRLLITCKNELQYLEWMPSKGSIQFLGDTKILEDKKVVMVSLRGTAPVLTPDNPLIIHVSSSKPIAIEKIERGPRD